MKKFYTDPLQAAYMVREFGVRFVPNVKGYNHASIDLTIRGDTNENITWLMVDGELDGWNNRIGDALKPDEKIYIHEDSLPIFEPQNSDVGIDSASRIYTWFGGKWIAQGKSSEPVYPVDIVTRWQQRTLKRFFTPQEEA